jgi:hypothetical protein
MTWSKIYECGGLGLWPSGDIYAGIGLYADDMLPLASTRNEMQEMMEVAEKHSEKWQYKFKPE